MAYRLHNNIKFKIRTSKHSQGYYYTINHSNGECTYKSNFFNTRNEAIVAAKNHINQKCTKFIAYRIGSSWCVVNMTPSQDLRHEWILHPEIKTEIDVCTKVHWEYINATTVPVIDFLSEKRKKPDLPCL